MIEYIQEVLPPEELLAQLCEETIELGHAALKMRRVLDGRNPTPVTYPEALEKLEEEVADVMLVLLSLYIDYNAPEYGARMAAKLERWAGRLREMEEGPYG